MDPAALVPLDPRMAAAIRLVCRKLSCGVDRVRMSAVCRSWLAAIRHDTTLTRSLPFLFYPNSKAPSVSCLWCVGECHDPKFPEELCLARCFGSYDGGWMFVAMDDSTDNYLFNAGTRQWIVIPSEVRDHPDKESVPIQFMIATLSSSPLKEECVGAALITRPQNLLAGRDLDIMFWKVGKGCIIGWSSRDLPMDLPMHQVEDILYRFGSFYVLVHEEIFIVRPDFSEMLRVDLSPMWFAGPAPAADGHFDLAVAGYLVEAGGDLLLLRRYREADGLTKGFQVLRLRVQQLDEDPVLYMWEDVPAPDVQGLMMFMARGSSRCYNTEEFNGISDGVFFLADVEWFSEEWEEMELDKRRRFAKDAGVWVNPPGCAMPIFVMPQQVNDCNWHSSSVWILPGTA